MEKGEKMENEIPVAAAVVADMYRALLVCGAALKSMDSMALVEARKVSSEAIKKADLFSKQQSLKPAQVAGLFARGVQA